MSARYDVQRALKELETFGMTPELQETINEFDPDMVISIAQEMVEPLGDDSCEDRSDLQPGMQGNSGTHWNNNTPERVSLDWHRSMDQRERDLIRGRRKSQKLRRIGIYGTPKTTNGIRVEVDARTGSVRFVGPGADTLTEDDMIELLRGTIERARQGMDEPGSSSCCGGNRCPFHADEPVNY